MKKVLVALLCGVMILGLVACNAQPNSSGPNGKESQGTEHEATEAESGEENTESTSEEEPVAISPEKIESDEPLEVPSYCTDEFATALVDFTIASGYEQQNFMISPTSLRAALCLAIAGADSNTKDELLKAASFETQEDAEAWYAMLLDSEKEFAETMKELESDDAAFSLANAIWANRSMGVEFDDDYVKLVADKFDAEANVSPSGTITDDINMWCNEKTNGMITHIVDNVESAPNVLLNALYLKSAWTQAFDKGETEERFFTTYDEQGIKMDFIGKTEDMLYYHDDDTTIAVLQLYGDKQFVVVMGDRANLSEKLDKLESKKVHFMMPKFEMESKFEAMTLMTFLQLRGVNDAINWQTADFSKMNSDISWYIHDIIQKDKITVDEEGLEAAAVTALIMKTSSLDMDEDEPVEFIADHPFSYYIYSGLGTDHEEMLFYGQLVDKLAE